MATKAAVCDPVPATILLAVAIEGLVDQEVPSYPIVTADKPGLLPPKAKTAVCGPPEAHAAVPVGIAVPLVQEEPL